MLYLNVSSILTNYKIDGFHNKFSSYIEFYRVMRGCSDLSLFWQKFPKVFQITPFVLHPCNFNMLYLSVPSMTENTNIGGFVTKF